VTNDKNDALMQEMSLQEVEEAVMSLQRKKAADPDHFTFDFFRHASIFLVRKLMLFLRNLAGPNPF